MSGSSELANKSFAAIFPGQGSQFVGMAGDLLDQSRLARDIMAQADSILGYELTRIMRESPAEVLGRTIYTQPAIFVHSFILWKIFHTSTGMLPKSGAGHSLGEYSALCAAGVISFEDALNCIKVRSRAMDDAQPPGLCGMMAVVGLSAERVREIIESLGSENTIRIANFNSPDQTVVSGVVSALNEAMPTLGAEKRCRCVMLPVSSAFHTQYMSSAKEELSRFLNGVEINPPLFPVISNVTACAFPHDASEVRRLLSEQVISPVLWHDSVLRMLSYSPDQFLEIGPGKVLTGLMKRIDRNTDCRTISTLMDIENFLGADHEI